MSEGENNVQSSISEVNEEVVKQKVELTVGDVQVMVNIIEIVTARGGFRAQELKGVGEYFEKISALLPEKESQKQ